MLARREADLARRDRREFVTGRAVRLLLGGVVVVCGHPGGAGQRLTSSHGSGIDLSRRRGTDDPSAG